MTYTLSTASTLAAPQATPPGGIFTSEVLVTLTNSSPTAEIRYTVDGTDPGPSADRYASPILLSVTTVLRARAYEAGFNASPISSYTFTRETLDTDGDGDPDATDPDDDNDGISDADEILAGTDPKDRTSFFRIIDVVEQSQRYVISWNSVSNQTYSLWQAVELETNAWSVIQNGIQASPPMNVYTTELFQVERIYFRTEIE